MNAIRGAMMAAIVVLVVMSAAAPAYAQGGPCDSIGSAIPYQFKVFGCLDRINEAGQGVFAGDPTYLHGWTLSCYPVQQPTHVQVWYVSDALEVVALTPDQFSIIWRGYRPDVAAYFRHTCNTFAPYWGYRIAIEPDVLPPGLRRIAVRFFDPAVGVGVNDQHAQIVVHPGSAYPREE